MKKLYALTAHSNPGKSLLIVLFAMMSVVAHAGNTPVFKNPVLTSGVAGKDGAIYRFPSVVNKVDALVKIAKRSSSLVTLTAIDATTVGYTDAFQPQVNYNNGNTTGAADWWMEFEVTFVNAGTTTPAPISKFDVSAIDVDGNGAKIREYVTFFNPDSYTIEKTSLLKLTNVFELVNNISTLTGKRFDGPTINQVSIDTSGLAVMVTTSYSNESTIRFRGGGGSNGADAAAGRHYSFYFHRF